MQMLHCLKYILHVNRPTSEIEFLNDRYLLSVVHYSVFTPYFRYPEEFKLDVKESAYDNKYINNWTPKKVCE